MESNPSNTDETKKPESSSLEASSTGLDSNPNSLESTGSNATSIDATGGNPSGGSDNGQDNKPKVKLLTRITSKINIYLLLMILVLFIAISVIVITYLTSKHISGTTNISSQTLTQNALEHLANSDTNTTVGSTNQVLNIQSSSVFAGKVLMRQDLEVAGNLDIGNTVSINDLSVAGTAQVGQLQVNKDLSVSGNNNVQGSVTIGKSLQVNGNGNFSGPVTSPQITTSSLQLNGDLLITHHLLTGGSTPNRVDGGALGSGGSSSVSGDDTGGSISINTGGSPSAGCFITVNFSTSYNSTPHVLITPIGSTTGGLSYYVNRTSTNFSVCDASAPTANDHYSFDYFVVD